MNDSNRPRPEEDVSSAYHSDLQSDYQSEIRDDQSDSVLNEGRALTAELELPDVNWIRTASSWAIGLGIYYLFSGLLALYFIGRAEQAPIELWVLEAGVLYTGVHMILLGRRLRRPGEYGISDLNTLVRVYIVVGLLYVIGFVLYPGLDFRLLIGIILFIYAFNVTIKGRRMLEELLEKEEGEGDRESDVRGVSADGK